MSLNQASANGLLGFESTYVGSLIQTSEQAKFEEAYCILTKLFHLTQAYVCDLYQIAPSGIDVLSQNY